MNKRVCLIIYLFVILSCCLVSEAEPLLTVPKTKIPPKIDGVITQGEWKKAAAICGFQLSNSKGLAKYQTHCQVSYDEQNIYLAFECMDGNTNFLKDKDWYNNCIEIFFATSNSMDIKQFLFDTKGKVHAAAVDSEYGSIKGYKPKGIRSVVKIHPKKWILEASIPLQNFGIKSIDTRYPWKFNFCRTLNYKMHSRPDGFGPEFSCFAFVPGQFKQLEKFANMYFSQGDTAPVRLNEIESGKKWNLCQLQITNPKLENCNVWINYFDGTSKQIVPAEDGIVKFNYSAKCHGFELTVNSAGKCMFNNKYYFLCTHDSKADKLNGPLGIVLDNSLKRIFEDNPYQKNKDTIELLVAKNEYENFQLLLYCGAKKLKNIKIRVNDLKSIDGKIISANNIQLFKQGYIKALGVGYPTVRGKGNYPDPLWPTSRTLLLKAGKMLPLWCSIYVPKSATPGNYTGNIDITIPGGKTQKAKVQIKVFDFTISSETHLKSIFSIWGRSLVRYCMKEKQPAVKFMKLLDQYCMQLIEHRLNPLIMRNPELIPTKIRARVCPKFVKMPDGKYKLEAGSFDELMAKCLKRGAGPVVIGPYFPNRNYENIPEEWGKKWQAVQEHYQQIGWLDNVIAYPVDEPSNANSEYVTRILSVIKKNAPGIKTLLTGGSQYFPSTRIKNVDIWVPQVHWVNYRQKREVQNAGLQVWWYPCSGPWFPYPNYHADTPAAAWRILPLMSWRNDFNGILYWSVSLYNAKNPMNIFAYGANGDGQLFYPDKNGFPIPSIRLKVIRDGFEDYEYLYRLKELVKLTEGKPGKVAILAQAKVFLRNPGLIRAIDDYELEAEKYKQFKQKTAFFIEQLKK